MEPMGSGKKIKGIFEMSDATKESLVARTNERWKANRIIPDENDLGTSRRAWFGEKKFQYSASLGLTCICVACLSWFQFASGTNMLCAWEALGTRCRLRPTTTCICFVWVAKVACEEECRYAHLGAMVVCVVVLSQMWWVGVKMLESLCDSNHACSRGANWGEIKARFTF